VLLQEAIVVGSDSHRSANVDVETLPLSSGAERTARGSASPLFPGFERMSFRVGTHWEYSWRESGSTNGEADPVQSGVVRIELSDPVDVDFGPAGIVTLYEATCSARSGAVPIWWPQWRYLGVKDGALYGGAELEDGTYGGVLLFDSTTGATHPRGFMGWSPSGERSVALGNIQNSFLTTPAVVVDESALDAECEIIGGVQIRDGEVHEYRVREYYLPGKGFGGWYRKGSSIFSGGGFVDFFEIALEVGLTSTSL
jgi:hypothetical protein